MSKTSYIIQSFSGMGMGKTRTQFEALKPSTAIKRFEKGFMSDRLLTASELYEFTGAPLGWVLKRTLVRSIFNEVAK